MDHHNHQGRPATHIMWSPESSDRVGVEVSNV